MMVGYGCSAQSHSIQAQVACLEIGLVVVIVPSLVGIGASFVISGARFHNN